MDLPGFHREHVSVMTGGQEMTVVFTGENARQPATAVLAQIPTSVRIVSTMLTITVKVPVSVRTDGWEMTAPS